MCTRSNTRKKSRWNRKEMQVGEIEGMQFSDFIQLSQSPVVFQFE